VTTELNGCGYKPEPPTRRQKLGSVARGLKVAARMGTLPPEGALLRDPYLPMLQGPLNDCQGVFVAQGHYLMTGELLSPEHVWFYARAIDDGGVGSVDKDGMTELENDGVTTSAIVRAAAEHGLCPYNMWNRKREDFHHAKLPAGLARTMAQKWLLDVRQIFATGDTLVNRHCDSIDKGFCPQIIVEVDEVFDAMREPIGPSGGGEIRGTHAVPAFRYRTRSDGRREIRVFTWGRTLWLSPERVGGVSRGAYLKGMKKLETSPLEHSTRLA
jgi:hypothetical protein